MHERPRLIIEFATLDELFEQIASNLRKGRAWVPGRHDLCPLQACELVLVHPVSGQCLPLPAEAVYLASEGAPGTGVEIKEPLEQLIELLENFAAMGHGEEEADQAECDEAELQDDSSEASCALPEDREDRRAPAVSAAAKVRGLNAAGRERIAKRGTLTERIALERAYGPAVWEALLANALLSTAEVAKIAKNHTATQPILAIIVASNAWLNKPEIRRALLSNPRLTEQQVERTLRALPVTELRLVLKQAAYPGRVRLKAKRLLGI